MQYVMILRVQLFLLHHVFFMAASAALPESLPGQDKLAHVLLYCY